MTSRPTAVAPAAGNNHLDRQALVARADFTPEHTASPRSPGRRAPTSRRPRVPWPWAAAAVATCVVLRLALVATRFAPYDATSAVTGLMARHIRHGEQFAFLAGQQHTGAGEQYLTAAFTAGLGENRYTLRLTGILLSALACWLVMTVVTRITTPTRAVLAGFTYAIGSSASLLYSVWPRGAHLSAQVIALLAVDLCLRPMRREWLRAFLVGLCATVGMWQSMTTVLVLIPVALWNLPSWWRSSSAAVAACAGAALGALPLEYAVSSAGVSFLPDLNGHGDRSPSSRLVALVGHDLPQALGLESAPTGGWDSAVGTTLIPGVPSWALVLPFLTAALVFAGCRWRGLLATLRGDLEERRPEDLLLLVFLMVPLSVVMPLPAIAVEPRYLVPLVPLALVALFLPPGSLRATPAERPAEAPSPGPAPSVDPSSSAGPSPRRPRRPGVLGFLWQFLAAATVLAVLATTPRWVIGEVRVRGDRPDLETSAERAARTAVDSGVTQVSGDYWMVEPLDLAAGGHLSVRQTLTNQFVQDQARSTSPGVWALAARSGPEARAYGAWLTAGGHTFAARRFGQLVLFIDIMPGLTPHEVSDPVVNNPLGN